MPKKHSGEINKKSVYIAMVGAGIVLAVLMAFDATREAIVGFLGWAVCVYIPCLVIIGALLLTGKKPAMSKKQTAVFAVLFFLFVATLHVLLAASLIKSDKSYVLAPLDGYGTVGGMLFSLITLPLKLLVSDYGMFLALLFVCTAIVGLVALYPFILNIKDHTKVKNNLKNEEKRAVPPASGKLLVEDIDRPVISEKAISAFPEIFPPKVPEARSGGALFSSLRNEEELLIEKQQKSAGILFRNEETKPKEDKPKYGALNRLAGEGLKDSDFYTNQGRQRLFDENMTRTFGGGSSEEEFSARYGAMPVYDKNNPRPAEAVKPAIKDDQTIRPAWQPSFTLNTEVQAPQRTYTDSEEGKEYINTPSGSFVSRAEKETLAEIIPPRESAREYRQPVYQTVRETKETAVQRPSQQSLFSNPQAEKAPARMKPYIAPSIDLLTNYPGGLSDFPENYSEMKAKIDEVMASSGIAAEVTTARRGPTFTRYELKLEPGQPIQKISAQQKNLMMRLCAASLRILAPIRGKDAVGIELPNSKRELVGLRSVLSSREFNTPKSGIQIAMGKNLEGQPFVADLAKMPHLLVAGATGTGKSVFINCLIMSILYKYSPEDVRLLLIDPKRVELSVYQNLPNLLIKETVKEPQHAVNLLRWLTQEMDSRFAFLEKIGCNELDLYNESYRDKSKDPKIPRIVLVIDEMADLMIKGKGQVEEYIVRIAQLGRACGIHLVLATQRPTVNVITGLIRANILARVAFTVKTNQDSRIILDEGGAEDLLGNGDMLFSFKSDVDRMQGAYIEMKDIKAVCDFIKAHNDGFFNEDVANLIKTEPKENNPQEEKGVSAASQERDADFEATLKKILKTFILDKRASVSSAQAKHNVGYIKAKKIVDALADRGYISQEEGAKPREVLLTLEEFYNIFGRDE